ncbi:hypothetical protein VP01_1174g2 [Puccinia sorghi]|uniref:AP-3 complex subunit delta n=1 Tax=Puccinia sorghi TaxID=27349 RepID=A0A0L6VR79_9BASI|nr:hypothetical protein VP01_1174g2 [Puccinia sorghi]
MWEQTLSGLIKALRASKDDEKSVIDQALSEIAREVKSTDLDLKAAAILKLCYLDMLGYPQLSSYSFHVVECMSSNKFYIKQIGYLAASQSFGPNTEVSMLTTNLVKKDLVSHSNQPMSFLNLANGNLNSSAPVLCLALSAIPQLLNSQNSADLSPDLISMLNHSKPTIRKRAVIAIHTLANEDMTRMIAEQGDLSHDQYTASLDPSSSKAMDIWVERFREKLLDLDVGVVSSTVNVICELASKYPWPWLELAAELYDLLKLKKNNWMMIKIVKIFTVLTPIEPRLTKKLLPALSDVISTTNAMSLLYECIHTILASGMLTHATSAEESYKLAKICTDKLAHFLDHDDPNLRYMALVGLNKLLPSHPGFLEDYLETILELIHEVDHMLTIHALDLLEGIQYHPQTLKSTVDYLINALEIRRRDSNTEGIGQSDAIKALLSIQLSSQPFHPSSPLTANQKLRVINVILTICSKSAYSHISDFNWFLEVLVRLIHLLVDSQIRETHGDHDSGDTDGSHSVTRLANVLIDVSSRVKDIRPYAVNKMLSLLHDDIFLENFSKDYCSTMEIGVSTGADSYGIDNEGVSSASNLVTAAIWICGEYSDLQYVDLKDVISTLFKRQLILDHSSRLPQISTFALHNGLKVFVKWLNNLVESWYSDEPSDTNCAEESFHADGTSHQQSPKQSTMDVELAQLNRLISAIMDRARDLAKQQALWTSSNFFPTVDHVQLLDRANEANRLMSLITRELDGFRLPPVRPARDPANETPHHASVYGMNSFGEVNPFAHSSGSPDDGFHRAMEDMNMGGDSTPSSKLKQVQPPYWCKVLSDLFFFYELKPVANSAQAMIQPPDELDLDSWIPYLKDTSSQSDSPVKLDEFGRKIGEDFTNPYQTPSSSVPFFDDESIQQNFHQDSSRKKRAKKKRNLVDEEALKKVHLSKLPGLPCSAHSDSHHEKTQDTSENTTDLLDIDSIPIIKLDLSVSHDDPPTAGPSFVAPSVRPHHLLKQTPSSSSSTFSATSRPLVVDTEGEMPDLSYLQKYKSTQKVLSVTATLNTAPTNHRLPTTTLSPNKHTDDPIVAHAPQSIKVVKKKSSSKKKKSKKE